MAEGRIVEFRKGAAVIHPGGVWVYFRELPAQVRVSRGDLVAYDATDDDNADNPSGKKARNIRVIEERDRQRTGGKTDSLTDLVKLMSALPGLLREVQQIVRYGEQDLIKCYRDELSSTDKKLEAMQAELRKAEDEVARSRERRQIRHLRREQLRQTSSQLAAIRDELRQAREQLQAVQNELRETQSDVHAREQNLRRTARWQRERRILARREGDLRMREARVEMGEIKAQAELANARERTELAAFSLALNDHEEAVRSLLTSLDPNSAQTPANAAALGRLHSELNPPESADEAALHVINRVTSPSADDAVRVLYALNPPADAREAAIRAIERAGLTTAEDLTRLHNCVNPPTGVREFLARMSLPSGKTVVRLVWVAILGWILLSLLGCRPGAAREDIMRHIRSAEQRQEYLQECLEKNFPNCQHPPTAPVIAPTPAAHKPITMAPTATTTVRGTLVSDRVSRTIDPLTREPIILLTSPGRIFWIHPGKQVQLWVEWQIYSPPPSGMIALWELERCESGHCQLVRPETFRVRAYPKGFAYPKRQLPPLGPGDYRISLWDEARQRRLDLTEFKVRAKTRAY